MKDRDSKIYIVTIIVVIIVYLVIYFFGSSIKKSIYDGGSEQNTPKQPVNNILSKHDSSNNNSSNNTKDKEEEGILFRYEALDSDYIELYNQFPTQDEVGMAFFGNKYTQNFRLKLNSHAVGVKYTITLKKQLGSDLEDDWAKVYLVTDGSSIANCFRESGRVKTFNEYTSYLDNPEEKILYEGVITYDEASRGYKDFTLRMWISEDVRVVNEAYLSKSFLAKVAVYAVK